MERLFPADGACPEISQAALERQIFGERDTR
jgi:hypothetical protein